MNEGGNAANAAAAIVARATLCLEEQIVRRALQQLLRPALRVGLADEGRVAELVDGGAVRRAQLEHRGDQTDG